MDSIIDVEDEFHEHGGDTPANFHRPTPLLIKYGWAFILILGIIFVVVRKIISELNSNRNFANQLDPELDIRRREAMELARIRMQQRMDEDVARHKAKEHELRKRRAEEKQKELELRPSGQSPMEHTHATGSDQSTVQSCPRRPKPKARLRTDEYNPLMGGASTNRYRPTSRFGSAGGGG